MITESKISEILGIGDALSGTMELDPAYFVTKYATYFLMCGGKNTDLRSIAAAHPENRHLEPLMPPGATDIEQGIALGIAWLRAMQLRAEFPDA